MEAEALNELTSLFKYIGGGTGGGMALAGYIVYNKAKKVFTLLDEINSKVISIDKNLAVQGEHIVGLDKRVENIENAPIHNGASHEIIRKLGQLVTGDMSKDLQDG